MPVLRIENFAGVIPVKGDRALPPNAAVLSFNTWLYGSELRGVRPPVDLIAVNAGIQRVLRIPKRTPGGDNAQLFPGSTVPPPSYLGDSVWKTFTDPFTDVVKGAMVKDKYERYYFCSPSLGPRFNTYERMLNGQSDYVLGVPGPSQTAAWTPTITGVSAPTPAAEPSQPVQEIEFSIADVGGTPSYANPGGKGNRTATITVASSISWSGGVLVNQLVNGNTTETTLKAANIHQTDKWIRFDFGVGAAKIIDEFTWYQADRSNYGQWQWQASTDNVNWTDLGAPFTLGLQTKQAVFRSSGATGYRFYRMYQENPAAAPMTTRSYVYTWVNEYDEESPPSLPVLGSGQADGEWSIGNIKDPSPNPPTASHPLYAKKYLYRTLSGGSNNYYRVAEIPLGTLTYDDDMLDTELTNSLLLESTYWQPPPSTLQGWVAMPNGFLVAFDKPTDDGAGNMTGGSTVYMCEPYRFHAWPPQYQYATETPIVGLGVIGQTCVVCTQGYPATIQGVKPASAAFTKSNTGEPCLSRGSIVSTPQGVVYASQNGLIVVGPGGIDNVTEQLITREEWGRDYYPQYLRAARYQNGYLALRYTPTGTVPAFPARSGFYIDPTALNVALTEFSDFTAYAAINVDFWSGEVFLLKSMMVMRWDPPTSDLMPIQWKSKEFQFPYEENFGAYVVYWDDARYSSYNYGTSIMPTTEKVRLKVWANRVLVYDQVVPRNGRPVRLPSGFKADIWQFEIRARAPVYSLHVASTVKELKAV